MRKDKGIYYKELYCSDISNCSDGEIIFEMFMLAEIQYCSNNRSAKWLSLRLEDRTGSINAKIWSDNIKMEYEGYQGHVVMVKGTVSYYEGRPVLNVEQMRDVNQKEFVLKEICRCLEIEKEKIYRQQIRKMISGMTNKNIQKFCENVFDSDMLNQMARLPVHIKGHHTYRGALLEHTCDVMTKAYCCLSGTQIVRETPCDLNVVIAGALLHDIASINMIDSKGYCFYSSKSKFLTSDSYVIHTMLNEKGKNLLDEKTFLQLMHIIESSHASGCAPMTREAMTVRSANILSADLEKYEESFRSNDMLYGNGAPVIWSRSLKREIARIKEEETLC